MPFPIEPFKTDKEREEYLKWYEEWEKEMEGYIYRAIPKEAPPVDD